MTMRLEEVDTDPFQGTQNFFKDRALGQAVPGLQEIGTINANTRPVVKNADGTVSTVRTFSTNIDGKEVLLPTVTDDGKIISEDEAAALYRQTGKHLGVFDTPENATAYAQSLHNQHEQEFAPAANQEPYGPNLEPVDHDPFDSEIVQRGFLDGPPIDIPKDHPILSMARGLNLVAEIGDSFIPVGRYADGSWGAAVPDFITQALKAGNKFTTTDAGAITQDPEKGKQQADLAMQATSLMAPGALVPKPSNAVGMFGGRLAKTAKLDRMKTAEQMVDAGIDAEHVRQKTGWHKGIDGKWKFEISDRNSKFTNPGDEQTRTLNAVFEHDELFKAYPKLKFMDVNVSIDPKNKRKGVTDYSRILVWAKSEEDAREIMLHELQHVVQKIENFGRGGSMKDFIVEPDKIKKILMDEIEHPNDKVFEKALMNAAELDIPGFKGKTISDAKKYIKTYIATNKKDADFVTTVAENIADDMSWHYYRRLSGEVEARNTAARANMTDETRQFVSPKDTQDIPNDQQHVRFSDVGRVAKSESKPYVPPVSADDLPTAETINSMKFYHGSGSPSISKESVSSSFSRHEGLIGSGFYTTDLGEISGTYAKARGKRAGGTVYEVTPKNVRAVVNFDAPLKQDVTDIFSKSVNSEFRETVKLAASEPDATPMSVMRALGEEVTEYSHAEGLPTSEFAEMFQNIEHNFREAGYDAFTHVGGKYAGQNKKLHRVVVLLDPSGEYAATLPNGKRAYEPLDIEVTKVDAPKPKQE